jgi:hypothetical protein
MGATGASVEEIDDPKGQSYEVTYFIIKIIVKIERNSE